MLAGTGIHKKKHAEIEKRQHRCKKKQNKQTNKQNNSDADRDNQTKCFSKGDFTRKARW